MRDISESAWSRSGPIFPRKTDIRRCRIIFRANRPGFIFENFRRTSCADIRRCRIFRHMKNQPTEKTKAEALALWALRTETTALNCPLRFRPVIIAAPNDDRFCVVDLGFAERHGFEPIRPAALA